MVIIADNELRKADEMGHNPENDNLTAKPNIKLTCSPSPWIHAMANWICFRKNTSSNQQDMVG